MFSKSRLVSIGLLLAILFISLTFTSYVEGLENASIVDIVNKDAPKTPQSTDAKASATASAKASAKTSVKALATYAKALATDAKALATDAKASATSVQAIGAQPIGAQPIDGVTLGKPLTVADITGVLQNNPGVQKLLDKSL